MKNWKKIMGMSLVLLGVSVSGGTIFAASLYGTPQEVVAQITGRTVESIVAEKSETGKGYGTIALEAGKLEAFKKEMLEMKKANLMQQVEKGTLTQEEADKIIAEIEERQLNCNGLGSGKGEGRGRGCGMNMQKGYCGRNNR